MQVTRLSLLSSVVYLRNQLSQNEVIIAIVHRFRWNLQLTQLIIPQLQKVKLLMQITKIPYTSKKWKMTNKKKYLQTVWNFNLKQPK